MADGYSTPKQFIAKTSLTTNHNDSKPRRFETQFGDGSSLSSFSNGLRAVNEDYESEEGNRIASRSCELATPAMSIV